MSKHKKPILLPILFSLLFCAHFLHAQNVTTFTRIGSTPTRSVILSWNLNGDSLSSLLDSQFVVNEVGGSDVTSTCEITIVESVPDSVYNIYVNIGDNYGDGKQFTLTYSEIPITSGDTTTINTTALPETKITSFSLNSLSDLGELNNDGVTSTSNLLFTTNSAETNIIYLKNGLTTIGSTVATGAADLIVTSMIANGNHSIYAYGVDTLGDLTFTIAPINVTIDTLTPSVPSAPTLKSTALNDTGILDSDGITSNVTPTIIISSLVVETGNEVVVESDIDGEVGRGNYAVDSIEYVLDSLSEGIHSITCIVQDSAGNESAVSDTLSFTIDISVPSTPVLALKPSSDTGRNNGDSKTLSTTPSFNIISESGTSIVLYEGSNSKATATSNGNDDLTSSLITTGSIYAYTTKVTDVAGNESLPSDTVYVDLNISSITALSSPTLDSDSGVAADNKTNEQTPVYTFNGLITINNRELIVSSNIDGEVYRGLILNSTEEITLDSLSEGSHNLTYYAEDIYGNVGASATISLEIDITPPTLTSVTIISNNASNNAMLENGNQSTLTFVSDETLKASFSVTLDGTLVTPTQSVLTYTASKIITSPVSYTQVSFSIPVEDEAGNISSDTIESTTNSSNNTLFPAISNSITAPGVVNYCSSNSYNFTVSGSTATGGSGTYTYSWERQKDAGSFLSLSSYGENYTENSGLSNGTYNYRRIVRSENIPDTSSIVSVSINSAILANTISTSSGLGYCSTIPANTLVFTATTPSGGNASYTYQWQLSSDGGATWNNTSGTSATYTHASAITIAGDYLFRRKVTSGGCTSFSNNLSFTITPSISDNTITNSTGTLVCLNENLILVGSTPSGGNSSYTYQWQQSINSGAYNDIGGATSQSYFISNISTAGNYTFRRIVTSGNCTLTSTSTPIVTVPAEATGYSLIPITTNYSDQQLTGVTLNISGLGAGEDFYCSGAGVVSTANGAGNNTFYPNLAGQGTHIIKYHITKGGCEKLEQVSFTVYDGSGVINLNPLYCEDDAAVALTIPGGTPSFVGGIPPYTLVRFDGTGTSGGGTPSGATFTPATVVASTADGQNETVTITAVYQDNNIIPSEFSVSQAVTVTKNHVAAINLSQLNYCIDASDFSVTANLNGSLTTNGTFVLDSDPPKANPITISPSSLTVGNHTLTYNYNDGNGCSASDMITISIHPLPTVSFDYVDISDDGDFCFDADTVFLQGKAGGSNVFSGAFSSSDALAGAVISYGDGTGAFIPSLANTDEFNLTEDFTISFSYTDGNSCVNSVDSTVTVFGYDEVTLARSSASDSVCYSEGDVTITPMEGGAAYTGTGVVWSIDSGNSGVTTQMDGTILFHPSIAATNSGETSTSNYSTHIITYLYENAEGCTREVNDTIYVKPLPITPTMVSSVPSYCSQDTGLQDLEVSGVAGAQFAWSADASFSNILSTTNTLTPDDAPTVTVVTTVSYWVRQTNVESCISAPLKIDITIYPKAIPPNLSMSNVITYCSGETVSLLSVATSGNSIKWYSDTGLTTQVGFGDTYTPAINTNVFADSTVTYYVTETTNGCEGLATPITITIYKTPDAPTFNPVALVCSGGALSSISVATGSNVKWYSDVGGTAFLGSGNNYLPLFGTTVVNDSTVSLYATSTLNGCESSTSQVNININALPVGISVNSISPYCEGDAIQSITASGEAGSTFEWFSDVGLTTRVGTTDVFDPMINAPSYPTLDTLNYWVVETALDGCVGVSLKVDIPVYPRPIAPTLDTNNQLVYCSGDVMTALRLDTLGNNIKWYSDVGLTNQVGFGDNFTPVINTNVGADSTVTFYVTETTNGCEGGATSTTITIYKTPAPPTFNAVALVCSGGALSSISVATGSNVKWYSDVGGTAFLGSGNNYLPSFGTTVVNDSTVSLYATSTLNGCESSTSQVNINIKALPVGISVNAISPYCEGDPLQSITATGETGSTFEWFSDVGLTTRVGTAALFDPVINAPSYPNFDTLNYWVVETALDGCVGVSLKVDIPVYPRPIAPSLDINNQLVYCSGDVITALSLATSGNNIKWYSDAALTNQVGFGDNFTPALNTNVGADSTATFYVTETTNGCEGGATSTTITIFKTPDAPTFNNVSLICSGDPLPNLSIATGVNIKWYSDALKTTLLGLGNNYLPVFSSIVTEDSVASLYASSSLNGCESDLGQVDIYINALPDAPMVPVITPYCEDDLIQPITATGETNSSYEWYTDQALTLRISTDQTFVPSINAPSYPTLDTLNYWVIQITPDGCMSTATKVNIPVYPTPSSPVVDTRNPVYCSGDVIQAINVTSGINIKWYDDSALSSIVSTNTSFTPPDPNSQTDYSKTYYITQTVNGCESDTTEVTLTINRTPETPSVAATLSYCSGDILQPMIVSSLVDDVTWYSDASLTNVVGTTNSFTPTDPTIVTQETTYSYYVADSHLGCEGPPLRLDIVIHPLPLFDLFGIDENQTFCQSDENPLVITTVSGGVLTSSTGALIRSNNEIVLENSPLGNHTIRYTYTNENNCVNFVERNFTIVDVPEVDFEFDVFCDTKVVQFRDVTTIEDATEVISWYYDFGAGEGSKFITDTDSAASYEHIFASSGFKTVTLTVETNEGCSNISISKSVFIGTPPEVDFNWEISEHGADMKFEEISFAVEFDTLDSWHWDFGDGTTVDIDSDANPNGTITHKYQNIGTYNVTLMVTTKRGCSRRLSKSVYVIPRIFLTNEEDEYFENFNTSNGGWVQRGTSSSWEHGIAQGENIISSTNVWVTNLTTDYNVSEDSYLNTPSFDISGLSRPMIIFDMQIDAEAHIDGVTLQYSLDSGVTWNVLGDVEDPINWFNSADILADPGHQVKASITKSKGWTGNTEESGGIFKEFRSIRHNLDQFVGEEHLRLRFAFKSNSDLEDEGVAIDNIFMGNRKKVVLVETMTNAGNQEDTRELPDLDSVLSIIDLDIFAINYHIKVDGKSDSLNLDNPEPSSGRKFYYGISNTPSTIVDGNSFNGHTEDFVNNYQNHIASRALLDPLFEVDFQFPDAGDTDQISVTITSNGNFPSDSSEIVVHVVTVETEIFGVEVSEGLLRHHNVMKSMSPSPGAEGTSFFGRSWLVGSQETFTVEWDNPQVYDTDKAEVIVFVQDNNTKEIFQAVRKNVSDLVSTEPRNVTSVADESIEWNIYPNPTSGLITIESPSFYYNVNWTISSMAGKNVINGDFTGNKHSVNLNMLPTGVYYIRHFSEGKQIGKSQKIVVLK